MQQLKQQRGFTLVELVMVIVLLGIISAVLAPVITSNITAYRDTRSRNELIARGRLALERLSREIHQAVPNSLRLVTGTTNTIEFVTASNGGRYVDRNDTLISAGSCPTAFRFSNDILVIGNTSPTFLQNSSSRVVVSTVAGASPLWTVTFPNHTFNDASPGKHYTIVDYSHEVGLASGALRWRLSSGIPGGEYDDAVDVTGADAQLIDGVSAVAFSYAAAADGMLNVNLTLADGNETVQLYEEIYVRNTP